jgi:hypothetical protein
MVEVKRKSGSHAKAKLPNLEDLSAIGPVERMPPRSNNQMLKRHADGSFAKGNKGNQTGCVSAARRGLNKAFAIALEKDFMDHGDEALRLCRLTDPSGYIRIVASMMPKEFSISDERQLSDEELAASITRLLGADTLKALANSYNVDDGDAAPDPTGLN